jgi:hypothetical protein
LRYPARSVVFDQEGHDGLKDAELATFATIQVGNMLT